MFTIAWTVNSVRKKLGMDGVVAAAARRVKRLVGITEPYPLQRKRKGKRSSGDRWPRLPIWTGYHKNRDLNTRLDIIERDLKRHLDFQEALLAELRRQRESDQQSPARLVDRIEELDRDVITVVGGGTRWEAYGVVAFIFGIAFSTWATEIAPWFAQFVQWLTQ